MAAGLVTLIVKDSQNNARQAQFWSSDGTLGGVLSPVHHVDASQLAEITDALGTIDGHVDGLEATAASILAKLSADPATDAKLEAVRALLAGTLTVAPAAGENHLGEVGGNTVIATNNFTRPADTTPYTLGDLVANSTTAGLVAPLSLTVARKNGGTGRVLRLRLAKSSATLTNASFRVHLFRDTPTTSAGDNAAFSGAVNGLAKIYIGYVDITMDVAFSDGAYGFGAAPLGPCLSFAAPAGSQAISALIEARAAYTAASAETFTLYAEVDRD